MSKLREASDSFSGDSPPHSISSAIRFPSTYAPVCDRQLALITHIPRKSYKVLFNFTVMFSILKVIAVLPSSGTTIVLVSNWDVYECESMFRLFSECAGCGQELSEGQALVALDRYVADVGFVANSFHCLHLGSLLSFFSHSDLAVQPWHSHCLLTPVQLL